MSDVTLTEAEREDLLPVFWTETGRAAMLAKIQQIIAARLAEAAAELVKRTDRVNELKRLAGDLEDRAIGAEITLAEVRRTSRILPCDGLCSDYAEEDCSLHGREPSELWEAIIAKNKRAEEAEAENARLRDTLARVETARARHPQCDRHKEGDPVSCGWKRTVQDIDAALAGGDS